MSGATPAVPSADDVADAGALLAHLTAVTAPRYGDAAVALRPGAEALAADLWRRELFPVVVLPGEAESAGIPESALLRVPEHTGPDVARATLDAAGYRTPRVLLLSTPDARRADEAALRTAWPDADIVVTVPAVDPALIAESTGISALLDWVGTDDDLPPNAAPAAQRLRDRGYGRQ